MNTRIHALLILITSWITTNAGGAILYVDAANPTPGDYTTWSTAATSIQDAIDASTEGDEIVVTNGVYATGVSESVRGSSRVVVDKAVTIRSVNGPEATHILGETADASTGETGVRCVYLANGASLVGFTLAGGMAPSQGGLPWGGGVYCDDPRCVVSNCTLTGNLAERGGGAYHGTLNNCVLSGNSASQDGGGACGAALDNCTLTGNSAEAGGGAMDGTLNNCTLMGNLAQLSGGGAAGATLYNCTLTRNSANANYGFGGGAHFATLNNCALNGNSAAAGGGAMGGTLSNCTLTGNSATNAGGGADGGTLNNCIVYYNVAGQFGANYSGTSFYPVTLNHTCTTPQPTNGFGNITNAPLFVDFAGGNRRLQPNSPCINSGRNANAPAGQDLDGNPRISGGTVDIGAYEFQNPASTLSYAWLQQFGLATDGSADFADSDGDHFNNFQEWRAGTNPTDALSFLQVLTPEKSGSDLRIVWRSVLGKSYFLERSTNLNSGAGFTLLAPEIQGQNGLTTHIDSVAATDVPRFFYRVGVK